MISCQFGCERGPYDSFLVENCAIKMYLFKLKCAVKHFGFYKVNQRLDKWAHIEVTGWVKAELQSEKEMFVLVAVKMTENQITGSL